MATMQGWILTLLRLAPVERFSKSFQRFSQPLYKLATLNPTVLVLVGLALAVFPAAAPYFGDGFPRTNDAFPHLYRVVALDRLVRAGFLWPRWSPDLVHGYGYPVFNFFPALSHLVVELLHLVGLPLTTAYRAAVLGQFWVAAWSAYGLGRALFGPAAGWAAALAYSYSPYLLYDVHVRGSLPEGQALALLPLLLLALWRAGEGRGAARATLHKGWVVATAVLFAAVLLSHPVAYPLMLPTGFWLLMSGWRRGWRSLAGPVVGLGLGVLLTAFLWLPALLEVGSTRAAVTADQGYAYRDNFLPLSTLFAWPRLPADPALLNPPVVRALPVVALLWAAVRLLWRRRVVTGDLRRAVFDWGLVLLLSIGLMAPLARPVWDVVPLLPQTLFPWRFLALASLAGALLLAAAIAADVQAGVRPKPLLALLTAVLVTAAVPWLFPPREPVPEAPTLVDLVHFEQLPLFIGTTTLGEYLPRWVEELPDTAEMRQQLIATGNPDRLQAADGVTVQPLDGRPWNATYAVQASQPVTLTYRQFYFPGWQATLDGRPLPVQPSQPYGLLEVTVPAGEYILRFFFGDTGARHLGWGITALGGLLSGLLLLFYPAAPSVQRPTRTAGIRPVSVLLLGLLPLVIWLFFSRVDTPLRRSTLQADGVWGRPAIQPLDFAGELRLLTYEQSAEVIAADEPVQLTLYWRALRPIGVGYDVGVHIVDEEGLVWSAPDTSRPADWRFVSGNEPWPAHGYRMDPFVLRLLDGTPPGSYTFRVGLVRQDTRETVAWHEVGHLQVAEPARGRRFAYRPLEAGMTPAPEHALGPGVRLLGTRLDRREAAPGDPVRLTLLWQVVDPAAVADAGEVTLTLVAETGERLLTRTAAIASTYPTTQWQAGDRLRQEVALRLPAATPAGEHAWRVTLVDAGGDDGWLVGALRINVPARRWDAPPLGVQVDARLGDVATLLGANMQTEPLQAGTMFSVTLAWQAVAETAVSYRVFLHLLGPDGQIVAQSDGEPANWTRPTTGWLPGEVVLDERLLALPADLAAGSYRLVAGLYDPDSGERLRTAEGEDIVLVAEWRR